MAYDEGLAQVLRDELAGRAGVTETRMFGALCFLVHGNMLCGTYRERGLYRVGKANEPLALALPGVRRMAMGARSMPGMVELDAEGFADDALRARLMALALDFVGELPPK